MASKNVSVTFSAQIGELIDGVKGAKSAIEFSLAPRSMRRRDGLKELAAVAGISLSIAGIKDFAELDGAARRQDRNRPRDPGACRRPMCRSTASLRRRLALTPTPSCRPSGRLQQNLERAQSGIGPTALALKALGLSAKELASLPIDQQISKLSDAFAKYADGGKKAALANELVRGGAENLLPAFDKGSAGHQKVNRSRNRSWHGDDFANGRVAR